MKKRTVKLIRRLHRGAETVFIHIGAIKELHDAARKLEGATWSNTYKTWYVISRRGVITEIRKRFDGMARVAA